MTTEQIMMLGIRPNMLLGLHKSQKCIFLSCILRDLGLFVFVSYVFSSPRQVLSCPSVEAGLRATSRGPLAFTTTKPYHSRAFSGLFSEGGGACQPELLAQAVEWEQRWVAQSFISACLIQTILFSPIQLLEKMCSLLCLSAFQAAKMPFTRSKD